MGVGGIDPARGRFVFAINSTGMSGVLRVGIGGIDPARGFAVGPSTAMSRGLGWASATSTPHKGRLCSPPAGPGCRESFLWASVPSTPRGAEPRSSRPQNCDDNRTTARHRPSPRLDIKRRSPFAIAIAARAGKRRQCDAISGNGTVRSCVREARWRPAQELAARHFEIGATRSAAAMNCVISTSVLVIELACSTIARASDRLNPSCTSACNASAFIAARVFGSCGSRSRELRVGIGDIDPARGWLAFAIDSTGMSPGLRVGIGGIEPARG